MSVLTDIVSPASFVNILSVNHFDRTVTLMSVLYKQYYEVFGMNI